MTPGEREEVIRLIVQMKDETDQAKLSDLIREFIMQRKQRRHEESSEK